MAISARQIGQSSSIKASLLWQISKQLENLTRVMYNAGIPPVSVIITENNNEITTESGDYLISN